MVKSVVCRALLIGAALLGSVSYVSAQEIPAKISSAANEAVPKKFADGSVRIAVVRQLNTGDYYQNWISGVQSEAKKLHVKVDVFNADGDNAKQALFLQQAVSTHPDAIVIGWGFQNSLKAGLAAAKDAHIPVIIYDADVPPSDDTVVVSQSHALMMEGILKVFQADMGGQNLQGNVIYVYVPGYHALDERNKVWQQFLKDNTGIKVISTIGVVNSNTANQTADQAKASLTANRDVKAIIAPYDEFAKGATLAVEELGLQKQIKVYGMDISTADIAVMTKPNSPWTVTATTDASDLGAVVVRTAAARIAGQLEGNSVVVPPLVITQDDLMKAGIKNVEQLGDKFPGLQTPDVSKAPWMDKVQ